VKRRSLRLLAVGAATVVGTALVYYLDPVRGGARRRAAREWMTSAMRALLGEPGTPSAPEHEVPADETTEGGLEAQEIVWWRRGDDPAAGAGEPGRPAVVFLEGAVPSPPRIVAYDAHMKPRPEPQRVPRRGRRLPSRLLAGAAAASASCAIVLAGWAVLLERDSEPSMAANPPRLSGQRLAISLLAQPGARRIPVRGARGALVLVVGRGGQAVLVLSDVASAPTGRAYQAWVIDGGTPTPAGLFSGAERVVALTRGVPKGATVAVTLEPARGASAPSSRPLFAAENS
jgi:Anti-sigma-K factor rskA